MILFWQDTAERVLPKLFRYFRQTKAGRLWADYYWRLPFSSYKRISKKSSVGFRIKRK